MENEPINVHVVNETAATGPGLVFGTIGLICVFAGLAMIITIGLLVIVPVVLIVGAGWLLVRMMRLVDRHQEYLDEMGLEEWPW